MKKPAGRSAAAPPRSRLKALLRWSVIVGVVLAVLGATTVVVLYKAIDIPEPNAAFQDETSFVYYADGKTEAGRYVAEQDRNSVPFAEIPQHMKDAVVAAEDQSFWENNGIDMKGILRAAFSNLRGNSTQGASTITQQYVKVLYLTQERTYKRKVKEAIVARKLAEEQTKEQVLEGYLNTIYFGRGAYGIDAAAGRYFNKDAKDLNLRESAVLASVINNPTQFDPANGAAQKQALRGRYERVLRNMNEMGKLTATEQVQAAKRLPKFPQVEAEASYGGQRGHVLELVKRELLRTGKVTEDQILGGGLRIYTTLTGKAMSAAEDGVKEVRPKLKGLHTAVASVEPGTGALRGFFGGQDYLDSQINWAVSGGPPGSTFKPFALAAGLEAGYSLKDTFEGNSPMELPGGIEVGNLGEAESLGDHGAKLSLLKATEKSVNTAYVDLTMSLPGGPQDVVTMANQLGIPKWNRKNKSLDRLRSSPGLEANATVALGSADVSPINMANAYATIANGGERADVYVVEKVEDKTGEVLYRHKVRTKRVLEEDVASDVSYALQQVVGAPEGTGNAAQALGRPAAGKTGTATNDDDEVISSWFAGFTPQMSTAVMYVRGSGHKSIEDFLEPHYGGTYPAQTWTSVMERILEGTDVEDFPEPAFVDGEAPEEGHAPYTPPPEPTRTPTKKPTKTQGPTKTVKPTPTETLPTEDPTTEAPIPGPCDNPVPPPSCETTEPSPDTSPTVEESPRAAAAPRYAYREEYAVS